LTVVPLRSHNSAPSTGKSWEAWQESKLFLYNTQGLFIVANGVDAMGGLHK
jgi:hypothetical protein